MATLVDQPRTGLSFWQKLAIGIAAVNVVGFGQFALRGFVDPANVPVWVHLHGVLMLAWLALLVVQPTLVERGNTALHRTLGWAGLALATAILFVGSYAGLMATALGRVPPFFTPAYFVALTQIGVAAFYGMVLAAILRRRETQWHRRLMLGATILILDPALGRLIPMPLIMPWGEWVIMAVQLAVVLLIAGHDRRESGKVHPATITVGIAIVAVHVIIEAMARTAYAEGIALRLAGG